MTDPHPCQGAAPLTLTKVREAVAYMDEHGDAGPELAGKAPRYALAQTTLWLAERARAEGWSHDCPGVRCTAYMGCERGNEPCMRLARELHDWLNSSMSSKSSDGGH